MNQQYKTEFEKTARNIYNKHTEIAIEPIEEAIK